MPSRGAAVRLTRKLRSPNRAPPPISPPFDDTKTRPAPASRSSVTQSASRVICQKLS